MKHDLDDFARAVGITSKALFQRQHRLDVLCAVALWPLPVMFVREVALQLRLGDNQVTPDFTALRAIGALLEAPGSRERYHQRVPHPVWPFALRMLVSSATRTSPSGQAPAAIDRYVRNRYGRLARPPELAAALLEL
jgi:hypothetical protein